MSNQTKIGLLLGLGVILLVGIIVSDHLATQSQNHITDAGPVVSTIGEINPTNQRVDIRSNFLAPAPTPGYETALANPQATPAPQLPNIMLASAPTPQPMAVAAEPAPVTPVIVASVPPVAMAGTPVAQPQLVPVAASPAQPITLVLPTSLPTSLPIPEQAPRTYTIKEGDTLSSIAAATLGSRNRWKDLLDANAKILSNAKGLKIGTVIAIPESETKLTLPPVAAATDRTPAVAAVRTLPAAKPARTYTVGKGDLLGSIAAKTMGSTRKVNALVAANRKALPRGEKTILKPGMVLTIPAQ